MQNNKTNKNQQMQQVKHTNNKETYLNDNILHYSIYFKGQ